MSDLKNAVANVLVNASNYPAVITPHVLGRDMSGLIAKVVSAVEAVLPAEPVRLARYHTRVHAMNRHAGYGLPVVVLAASKEEAVSRAIDLAWTGQRDYARVTIDNIEDTA